MAGMAAQPRSEPSVRPEDVRGPDGFTFNQVVCDDGEGSFAVAIGRSNGEKALAIRTNGRAAVNVRSRAERQEVVNGAPVIRRRPVYFVLSCDVWPDVLAMLDQEKLEIALTWLEIEPNGLGREDSQVPMHGNWERPESIRAPKNLWTFMDVVVDFGPGRVSLATGSWDSLNTLAIRMNGVHADHAAKSDRQGFPRKGGHGQFYVLPPTIWRAFARRLDAGQLRYLRQNLPSGVSLSAPPPVEFPPERAGSSFELKRIRHGKGASSMPYAG